jgi:hypothetical protein
LRPLTLFLSLFWTFSLAAQSNAPVDNEHAVLLTGKKRSLIAYAGPGHSFTLEPAHTAKPSDVPGFITIDKQILQATVIPVDKSIDVRSMSEAKERDVLQKYMQFELDYYRKKLKQKYSNLQTEWVTLQGRQFLVWYFDTPQNEKLISRQIYVTTLFYDQVMDLNAPVFRSDDWGKARSLLVKLAGTMKTYDKRVDMTVLRKKL